MHVVTALRGFLGDFGPMSAGSRTGGSGTGVPKSDYIKQLQCLIAYSMNAPDSNKAWQSSKELWDNAVAYDKSGGIPVTGSYKTSWPTENDAMWMLSRTGAGEFAVFDTAAPSVDSNLLGYIQAMLAYLARQGQQYGYWPDVNGCNFPGATQAKLDAEAAAAAAAAQAAAEAQARKDAEATAIEAARVAKEAAQAAEADAARKAAEIAMAAAAQASTEKARQAAMEAAAAAQAAAQAAAEPPQQPSAGARAEVVNTEPSATPSPITLPGILKLNLTRNAKIGVGLGLLVAVAAGTAYGVHRHKRAR